MPDSSTILLVDDEDSVQKLLTYPLERDGFRVVQARDGEQALKLFGQFLELGGVIMRDASRMATVSGMGETLMALKRMLSRDAKEG